MSCYECDETFTTEETLEKHLKECINDYPNKK